MADKIIAQKSTQVDIDKQVQELDAKDSWETPVLNDCGAVADITQGGGGFGSFDGVNYS